MGGAGSRAALIAVVLVALHAPGARAQEDGEARARLLFAAGVEAADAGRWEDARARFEETYALLPLPQVLLNLAGAQARTGRLTAAAEAYRRLVVEADVPDALRDAARGALETLEPRIPRLTLRLRGPGGGDVVRRGDRVRLDATVLDDPARETERPLDPGRHSVVVEHGDVELVREDFRLYEGERLRLDLRVPDPPRAEAAPMAIAPDDGDGDQWFESPVLWAIVGVVVAGGIAIGIALSVGTEQPFVGNLGPGAITVR